MPDLPRGRAVRHEGRPELVAPRAAPPGRARLDGLELTYAVGAVGLGVSAWAALVLASLGLFFGAPGALAALALGAAVAAALGWRLRAGADLAWPRLPGLAVVAGLVLLAAALLGRPHEYVLGGLDPGVYVNTGALIASSGTLVWRDSALALLPAGDRAALFPGPSSPFAHGSRLVGFYLEDLAAGRVVPHGMHLFPAALAIGHALGGLPLALQVPSLLAGLASGAVGLLARRLAGGAAGALAALLLLVNPAETWFGRYPAAETAVQAFLFAGLAVLALALSARSGTAAALGGGLLGLVHLAKIETLALPAAVAAVFLWLWLSGRLNRLHGWFLAGYAALVAHAVAHAGLIATHYAASIYGRYLPPPALGAAAVLLAAAGAGAAWLWRADLLRLARWAEARAGGARLVLTAAVGLALAYGWLIRPSDPWGELAATPEPLRFMVRNRLESLPRLGWYLPNVAALAAAAGLLLLLRRRPAVPAAILAVLLPLEALVVLSDPRITAEYPWAARRWVGVLIPVAVLFAAAFAGWLPGLLVGATRVSRGASRVLGAGLAAAMVGLSVLGSSPLLDHREYAGAPDLIAQVASRVDPTGVVLLDDDLVGWRLSAPLQFLAGRSSFVPFGDAGRGDRAAGALASWEGLGRPLYWLRHGEAAPFERWGRRWTPVQTWKTALPEVVPTTDRPPFEVRLFAVPITLYRVAGEQ